jgi:hypothetical protein
MHSYSENDREKKLRREIAESSLISPSAALVVVYLGIFLCGKKNAPKLENAI